MFIVKTVFAHHLTRCTHRNLIRHVGKDPGIGLRKKLVSTPDEGDFGLPDFDDLETDFMDVHKSHKEHLRELQAVKEREQYLMVRQKYFKEKFPNFLTWHDKEQIRYLYRTDPEEWTIEKLSEGFPALPETIKKIVKANWKIKEHKITNHDKSVQRNWEQFKNGEMPELPADLKEHLNKFTNRALNFNKFEAPDSNQQVFKVKTSNVGSEFSEIISSYEKVKRNSNPQIEDKEIVMENRCKPPLQDTYLSSKSSRKKSMVTLDQLQENLQKKLETGKLVDEEEKVIVMNLKPQETKAENVETKSDISIQNAYQKSTSLQLHQKTKRDLSHLNYPEKISIPKDIYKKGFIYKLNDCYYDDDGEFLYRVPGMD